MKDQTAEDTLPFLKGGGEMGKITREKNWEDTVMGGHPDQWPSSIKPILSLLLNSKSPMFLFWGGLNTFVFITMPIA